MEALTTKQDQIKRLDLSVLDMMRNGKNRSLIISEKSIDTYRQAGEQFNRFLENNNFELNVFSVKRFLNSQGWGPATVNLKRQALINILSNQDNVDSKYILIAGIKEAFKKEVKRVKMERAKSSNDYLTEAQKDTLKNFCDKKTALMIQFLFESGCRVSEMLNIKLSDIELNGQAKIKVIGKGSKQRAIYVKRELIEMIIQVFNGKVYLFETRNGTQYNRINVTIKINKVGNKAGLKIHSHTFRHSCAMHLKSKNASPEYIQKYLGHSSVAITIENYFHGKPGEEITGFFN